MVWLGVNGSVAGAIAWILGTLNGYYWNRTWTFERADHKAAVLTRYFAVGMVGAGLNAGLIAVFEGLGVARFPAGVAALPFVVVTTYLLNRFWTFGGHLREARSDPPPEPLTPER